MLTKYLEISTSKLRASSHADAFSQALMIALWVMTSACSTTCRMSWTLKMAQCVLPKLIRNGDITATPATTIEHIIVVCSYVYIYTNESVLIHMYIYIYIIYIEMIFYLHHAWSCQVFCRCPCAGHMCCCCGWNGDLCFILSSISASADCHWPFFSKALHAVL